MWGDGRGNSGGSWLPEEKKANMWHGRGNSGGSWLPAFPRSSRSTFMYALYVNTFSQNIFIHQIQYKIILSA